MKLGLYDPLNEEGIEYVTSDEIITSGSKFHPLGLFSDEIWSYTDNERREKNAGIDLHKSGIFIHAKVMESITRQKVIYEGVLGKGTSFIDGKFQIDEEDGMYGIYLLYDIIQHLDKYADALNPVLYEIFNKYKMRIFVRGIYVIPPALRDAVIKNNKIESMQPINNIYTTLIRYSKSTYINEKDLLKPRIDYELYSKWYKIQHNIVESFMLLKQIIGKKEGFIRQNIIGKRVDFSARVVAGCNPKLEANQVEIPYKVAAKLYEPYIGYHIFKNNDLRNAFASAVNEVVTEVTFSNIMTRYKNGNVSANGCKLIENIIDKHIVGNYPVIMKRDPSLHRLSWQAFNFSCVTDDVVFVSPMVVDGFNLDFDGDQLALYTPITKEAQREVTEKMMNQHTNPGSGKLSTKPSQDVNLAVYIMTNKESTNNTSSIKVGDVVDIKYNKNYNINTIVTYTGIKGKNIVTTYGRYVYNMMLPKQMKFINETVKGKAVSNHMNQAKKLLDDKSFNKLTAKILEISGIVNSMNPISIAPEELQIPENIKSLAISILKDSDFVTAQDRMKKEVMPKVQKWLKSIDSGLYTMIESGARGSWDDVEQLLVAKGFISDNEGRVIDKPIMSSLSEGLNPREIVDMGSSTAKGSYDRSMNTGETGYLERQLVFACNSAVINEKDCGTSRTFEVDILDINHAQLFINRFCKEIGLIIEDNLESIVGKTIHIRTPMLCDSKKGICEKCYGTFFKSLKSKNVGIVAATALGERGTQLMMRTFHTGGRAEGGSSIPYISDVNVDSKLYNSTIKQVKNKLISLDTFEIEININSNYTYVDDVLLLKDNMFTLHYNDSSEEIRIDGFSQTIGLEFKVAKPLVDDTTNIKFVIKPNTDFGKVVFMTTDMSQQVKEINAIFQGNRSNNMTELYNKLYDNYGRYGVLSVHYEIAVMQMTRSKDNEFTLWRLMPKSEQLIVGIKKVPYLDSSMLGIAFENIGKGIESGLLNDNDNDSPLDQLINSSIDPEYTISERIFK